jgi:hypothetical protein
MKKYIINISLLLLSILIIDMVAGYFIVPVIIKKMSGVDIHNHQKIHTQHPYYNHGFNPNQTAQKTFGTINYTISTNSLGMIDSYSKTINPQKKNIVFIGDSYTEGIGIPFNKTFCGLLQQQFDTSHTNILNAGVASFSPKLYYLRIKYLIEVQQLIPNEIYCLPDFSDYGDELVYEDFKPSHSFSAIEINRFLASKSILYNFYHWLMRKWFLHLIKINANESESFIYSIKTNNNFIKKYPDFLEIRQNWLKAKNMKTPTFKKAQQLAEANMDSLHQLCLQHNIKLNIIGYPRKSYAQLSSPHVQVLETFWKNYSHKKNIQYLSLYPEFATANKNNIYLSDDAHWNENGHEIVAQKIKEHMARQP